MNAQFHYVQPTKLNFPKNQQNTTVNGKYGTHSGNTMEMFYMKANPYHM